MLNSTRIRFTVASCCTKDWLGEAMASSTLSCTLAPRTIVSTAQITTLTAGPASATRISCFGSSGIRSSRASPPMGNSVMSGVLIPNRRAMNTWPSSCSTTQANSARMNTTLPNAAAGPPADQADSNTQANSRKNVRWMRISVPRTEPMENDQLIPD